MFTAFYGLAYIVTYIFLGVFSFWALRRFYHRKEYHYKNTLVKSNHTLGVSIIAPAYNESTTIVYSVKSLLSQEYANFEVIIINDGSTDDTLEKLVREFDLISVQFYDQKKLPCKTVRGHYKSTNTLYGKLLVIDKENGGCKADGSNAGINASKYPIFICTDVDCILRKDTISQLVRPFMESKKKVIATGAMLRISNSCRFKDGMLTQSHFPTNFYARFQELEYIRAFLYGRMAWSHINSLILVSGGLGMFDKEVAIAAGGYWDKSLGEDLELITRMRRLMHIRGDDFNITYIPETLCWTEVPSSFNILLRQRTRWGRGLAQTLFLHKGMLFNPDYGRTGFLAIPYFVFFEFASPIVECLGLLALLAHMYFFSVNWHFFWVVTLFVYLLYVTITLVSVFVDQFFYKHYANLKQILLLIVTVLLEPIVYHPLNVFAYLRGYYLFLLQKKQEWGAMPRKGFEISN